MSAGTKFVGKSFNADIFVCPSNNANTFWTQSREAAEFLVCESYNADRFICWSNCFPESELVNTVGNKYSTIASLKIGDKITSWNEELKKEHYTTVTGVYKYGVNEIMCLNGKITSSSTHPFLVMERNENGLLITKWKCAFDIKVGEFLVGASGDLTEVKTSTYTWYDKTVDVFNITTENGAPYMVRDCVVKSEHSKDNIEYSKARVTQKLIGAVA